MSTIIESIESEQLRRVPRFGAGDRVRVHFLVVEGTRTRTQVFEGVVIRRQGSAARETFTVRKQSFGVGVERTFPVHSPKIEQLEVAARGDVRRAKLYYLRDRVGKAARIAERRWGITDDVLGAEEEAAVDAEGTSQVGAEAELAETETDAEGEGSGEGAGTEAVADAGDGDGAAEEASGAEAEASEGEPADEATEAEADPGAQSAAEEDDDQAGDSGGDATDDEAPEQDR